MNKGLIIGIVILLVVGGFVGWYVSDGFGLPFTKCLDKQLLVEGDGNGVSGSTNQVLMPSCALEDGTGIDVVLSSVIEYVDKVYYYNDAENKWYGWYNENGGWGNLWDFQADKIYYISVTQDCVLTI